MSDVTSTSTPAKPTNENPITSYTPLHLGGRLPYPGFFHHDTGAQIFYHPPGDNGRVWDIKKSVFDLANYNEIGRVYGTDDGLDLREKLNKIYALHQNDHPNSRNPYNTRSFSVGDVVRVDRVFGEPEFYLVCGIGFKQVFPGQPYPPRRDF